MAPTAMTVTGDDPDIAAKMTQAKMVADTQSAGCLTHDGACQAHQALGDGALGHDVTGEDEEGNRQFFLLHGLIHVLRDDVAGDVLDHGHAGHRRHAHGQEQRRADENEQNRGHEDRRHAHAERRHETDQDAREETRDDEVTGTALVRRRKLNGFSVLAGSGQGVGLFEATRERQPQEAKGHDHKRERDDGLCQPQRKLLTARALFLEVLYRRTVLKSEQSVQLRVQRVTAGLRFFHRLLGAGPKRRPDVSLTRRVGGGPPGAEHGQSQEKQTDGTRERQKCPVPDDWGQGLVLVFIALGGLRRIHTLHPTQDEGHAKEDHRRAHGERGAQPFGTDDGFSHPVDGEYEPVPEGEGVLSCTLHQALVDQLDGIVREVPAEDCRSEGGEALGQSRGLP